MAVTEICGLGELTDGFQLFSTKEEPKDAQAYVHQVSIQAQKSLALACKAEQITAL